MKRFVLKRKDTVLYKNRNEVLLIIAKLLTTLKNIVH